MNKRSAGSYRVRFAKDFKRNKYIYLMATPILAYYIIFNIAPLGGLAIAFQNYNLFRGFWDSPWVGFEHFIRFFTGPYAWRVIRNTFLINLYSILFSFPTPILFALLLNELKPGVFKKISQTISYMPHFISLIVICGMINEFCGSNGILNIVRGLFGLPAINLLQEASMFRTIFIGSNIWQGMGWSSIIYLATLSTVDQNLYEAAYIDGASRLQRMRYVTIPALIPVVTVQFIMRVGHILSVGFEKIILLYNPLTYETADVISSYVYRYGLEKGNYSFGTAVGIFNSIVSLTLIVMVNKTFKRYTENSLW